MDDEDYLRQIVLLKVFGMLGEFLVNGIGFASSRYRFLLNVGEALHTGLREEGHELRLTVILLLDRDAGAARWS
jgi:hypothetical protein